MAASVGSSRQRQSGSGSALSTGAADHPLLHDGTPIATWPGTAAAVELARIIRFGRHSIGKGLQRLPYADAISKVGLCSTLNDTERAIKHWVFRESSGRF
jgi:hypothetical protein